jgi:hypothetical protein
VPPRRGAPQHKSSTQHCHRRRHAHHPTPPPAASGWAEPMMWCVAAVYGAVLRKVALQPTCTQIRRNMKSPSAGQVGVTVPEECQENARRGSTPGQRWHSAGTAPEQRRDSAGTAPGQRRDSAGTAPGQRAGTAPGQRRDSAGTAPQTSAQAASRRADRQPSKLPGKLQASQHGFAPEPKHFVQSTPWLLQGWRRDSAGTAPGQRRGSVPGQRRDSTGTAPGQRRDSAGTAPGRRAGTACRESLPRAQIRRVGGVGGVHSRHPQPRQERCREVITALRPLQNAIRRHTVQENTAPLPRRRIAQDGALTAVQRSAAGAPRTPPYCVPYDAVITYGHGAVTAPAPHVTREWG